MNGTQSWSNWMLDRIKRGQFDDLSKFSDEELQKLSEDALRLYALIPESEEVDRGRAMLLQGRADLELRSRKYAEKLKAKKGRRKKGEPTTVRRTYKYGSRESMRKGR